MISASKICPHRPPPCNYRNNSQICWKVFTLDFFQDNNNVVSQELNFLVTEKESILFVVDDNTCSLKSKVQEHT